MNYNLIFLGCGFVGRNLVSYLVKNDLTSAIRVVDKVPPQVAWLNETHTEAFANSIVEFKSANLINPGKRNTSLSRLNIFIKPFQR